MIRNAILLILILAAAGFYTWYEESSARTAQIPAAPESNATAMVATSIAPDFTFKDMDGKTHRLSAFKDKTIILNFWASWCAPCIIEFPQMLNLAKANENENENETVFLFLSQDENAVNITRFLAKFPAAKSARNIHIAQDTDKHIAQKLFGTYKLPETYLIAPGLIIKEKIIGLKEPWDSPDMQQKIKRLTGVEP